MLSRRRTDFLISSCSTSPGSRCKSGWTREAHWNSRRFCASVCRQIPDWLIAIVDKLHAKDPSGRFQNAREAAELLNQHLAQLQLASWTPQPGDLSEKTPASAARASAPITSVTICPSCGSHLHVPDK